MPISGFDFTERMILVKYIIKLLLLEYRKKIIKIRLISNNAHIYYSLDCFFFFWHILRSTRDPSAFAASPVRLRYCNIRYLHYVTMQVVNNLLYNNYICRMIVSVFFLITTESSSRDIGGPEPFRRCCVVVPKRSTQMDDKTRAWSRVTYCLTE